MFFDTPVYLLFLVAVVFLYWRLGWRKQNVLLLLASYLFYGWWDWRFLMLMVLSTLVDYRLALLISDTPDLKLRKRLLIVSLVMNFGFLGVFKYFNFFVDSFLSATALLGFHGLSPLLLKIVLPPGISFYTFQAVAYIVDVYFGKQKASRSLVNYALFISLFPHLIAGPIQRPSHLLPQVENPRTYEPGQFFGGLMLILTGLFRKCFIADNCAVMANAAFNGQLGHNAFSVFIGVFAFAWQIYGDFAGYSDMARGSAQLLGFHFMVNFRQPYFATSLQEFWRRWHISLSTWLRDYLYIPLGGNRKGAGRTYVNLLATMLIGGFWHGANWTFVVWGGLHGMWLSIERLVATRKGDGNFEFGWIGRVVTLAVVGLSWVFFRSESLQASGLMLSGLTSFEWTPAYGSAAVYLAAVTALGLLLDWRLEQRREEYLFESSHPSFSLGAAMAMMSVVALFGAMQTSAFIYFQF